MKNVAFGSAWLVQLCCLVAPALGAEPSAPLEVEPSVAAVFAGLKSAEGNEPLGTVEFTLSSNTDTTASTGVSTYESLPNRVIGITTTLTSTGATSRIRTLSLCGLIDLAAVSEGKIDTRSTAVVPSGRVFLPLSIHSTVSRGAAYRARALAVDPSAEAVCSPKAGDSFEYQLDSELMQRAGGLFTPNSGATANSTKWRCTVDAAPARLTSEPTGPEYLPVNCTGSNARLKDGTTAQWAYFPSSGVYLRLGGGTDKLNIKYEYQKLEPAKN